MNLLARRRALLASVGTPPIDLLNDESITWSSTVDTTGSLYYVGFDMEYSNSGCASPVSFWYGGTTPWAGCGDPNDPTTIIPSPKQTIWAQASKHNTRVYHSTFSALYSQPIDITDYKKLTLAGTGTNTANSGFASTSYGPVVIYGILIKPVDCAEVTVKYTRDTIYGTASEDQYNAGSAEITSPSDAKGTGFLLGYGSLGVAQTVDLDLSLDVSEFSGQYNICPFTMAQWIGGSSSDEAGQTQLNISQMMLS